MKKNGYVTIDFSTPGVINIRFERPYFSTFVAPFDVDFSDTGVDAYIVTKIGESSVELKDVLKVPAGAAVVIGSKRGSFSVPQSVNKVDALDGNLLKAATENIKDITGKYSFTDSNLGFVFYPIPKKEIPAGKGYLEVESGAQYYKIDILKSFSNCITEIQDSAYWGNELLKSVIIPDSVTKIGTHAFSDCKNLSSVIIPNSVTEIGKYAFSVCESLKNITIPDSVTKIEEGVFQNCKNLTNITIPDSVTEIGALAFAGCPCLTEISFPDSVTEFDSFVIDSLTSIVIPKSAKKVERAFDHCKGRNKIIVSDGNPVYDSRNNCNAIIETMSNTLILGCSMTVIPNSVTKIASNAFTFCEELKDITLPDSIKEIERECFNNCRNLTSIIIPNSVTTIKYSTFANCKSLKSVIIPNSVTCIESQAFFGCESLTSIDIPESIKEIGDMAFSYCPLKIINVPAKKANFYKSLLPEKLHSLIVELPAEKKTKK